jgi:hypothetical protein
MSLASIMCGRWSVYARGFALSPHERVPSSLCLLCGCTQALPTMQPWRLPCSCSRRLPHCQPCRYCTAAAAAAAACHAKSLAVRVCAQCACLRTTAVAPTSVMFWSVSNAQQLLSCSDAVFSGMLCTIRKPVGLLSATCCSW